LHMATLIMIIGLLALVFSKIPSLGVIGFAGSIALGVGYFASIVLLPPLLLKSR